MIPKQKRVTKVLFADVLQKGKRIEGQYVYLKVLRASQSRFSAVVPKSVEKQAVKRNTIRRRIRAIAQKNLDLIKGYAICFAKKDIQKASFKDLELDLAKTLGKI